MTPDEQKLDDDRERGLAMIRGYAEQYGYADVDLDDGTAATDLLSDVLHGVSQLSLIGPIDDVRRIWERVWMHFEAEYGGPDHPSF